MSNQIDHNDACLPVGSRNSLIDVYFEEPDAVLEYYNEAIDLHPNDTVYVDGLFSGYRGRVEQIHHRDSFQPSDYRRITARVDMSVKGKMHIFSENLLTFDPGVIPFEKVLTWYRPPCTSEAEIGPVSRPFQLRVSQIRRFTPELTDITIEAIDSENVIYLEVNEDRGRAIIMDNGVHVLRFLYDNDIVSELSCDCGCASFCRHKAAAMLLLNEHLQIIADIFDNVIDETHYYAAMNKEAFFKAVVKTQMEGSITMDV